MKTIKTLIFIPILSLSLVASEIDSVSITLTDIKEALYGLLNDTRELDKSLKKAKEDYEKYKEKTKNTIKTLRNADSNNKNMLVDCNKSLSSGISLNSDAIENNIKKLELLSHKIYVCNKKIEKIQAENLLYKKDFESFIQNNESLLPKGK